MIIIVYEIQNTEDLARFITYNTLQGNQFNDSAYSHDFPQLKPVEIWLRDVTVI